MPQTQAQPQANSMGFSLFAVMSGAAVVTGLMFIQGVINIIVYAAS